MKFKTVLFWTLRLIPAIILLQTLYFKFTGAPESVYIFSTLGIEPWGRILTGVFELVAALLLLVRITTVIGAALAGGLMTGAILSHIFVLGIEVMNDGGLLFFYATLVLFCSVTILILKRDELFRIPDIIRNRLFFFFR
ncbi:MAG: DoxX family protein [Flavitalea sp.]